MSVDHIGFRLDFLLALVFGVVDEVGPEEYNELQEPLKAAFECNGATFSLQEE